MILGALGVQAASSLYHTLTTPPAARLPPGTGPAGPGFQLDGAASANPAQSLTAEQPPSHETAIGKNANKLIADLNALLLKVQGDQ